LRRDHAPGRLASVRASLVRVTGSRDWTPMTVWRHSPLKLPAPPAEYETDMTDTTPRSIDDLLAKMVEADASDLHLAVGSPAVMRVRGEIVRIPDETPLSPEESRDLIYGILNTGQQ